MNQPSLPFALHDPVDLVRTPRARHDDPATSQAAARRVKVAQHAHCWWILRVLRLYGNRSLNAHEIAAGTDVVDGCVRLTQVQVARRLKELLDAGLVRVDGVRDGSRCFRSQG